MKSSYTFLGLALILILTVYGFNLGSPNLPSIGDEGPYLQVTRVMALSGQWLPVQAEEAFLSNTKPPMLFWQGLLSTNWGQQWTLEHLRWPVVTYSLLNAALVFFLIWSVLKDLKRSAIGAMAYLGFLSTLQQGRTYLMHSAEVFYLFLPFVLWSRKETLSWPRTLAIGMILGIGALYKSFLIMLPVLMGLWILEIIKNQGDFVKKILLATPKIVVMGLVGLGCFSIWFLLDPHPELVWNQFILGQNAGKFTGNYFQGMFSGPYTIFRIWLGNLTNGVFYAPLIIALVIFSFKNKAQLKPIEKSLWIYILPFLIIYTLPSQRQENYILPTTAALSVLLGLNWDQFKTWVFQSIHGLLVLVFLIQLWVIYNVRTQFNDSAYSIFHLLLPLIFLITSTVSVIKSRWASSTLPFSILGVWLGISVILLPFGQPMALNFENQINPEAIYVPENFPAKRERFRFIIENQNLRGYNAATAEADSQTLINQGLVVAIYRPYDAEIPADWSVHGQTLDVRTRHSTEQIKDILFKGKMELLFNRLLVVSKK